MDTYNIGILHLSDIHACQKNEKDLDDLVVSLKKDLEILLERNHVKIGLICLTGDLINSGDNSDEEILIVYEHLLRPLIEYLHLSNDNVFIVPGNHEVKRSKIKQFVENGLLATLKSEEDISHFISSGDYGESTDRIDYFEKDIGGWFHHSPLFANNFAHTHIVEIGQTKIGIACINSAWRSTGCGIAEKGKMIIGRNQILDSLASLQSADLKICLMHHPLDWLLDEDKSAIEKCINSFDIVLNGHIHESNLTSCTTFNGITLFNTCGKFAKTSDVYNGYSLLSFNPCNCNCDIILRKYYESPRNEFDAAVHLCTEGQFSVALGVKDEALASAYNIVHSI